MPILVEGGSKRQLWEEGLGVPLSLVVTGAPRHDKTRYAIVGWPGKGPGV